MNTWYPVEPRDDMIVVNFGDVFEYWSNGMIKSTIHRVNLPIDDQQNDARYSIAFFCDPNGDTRLTPIPSKLIENRVYTKDQHANHIFTHNDKYILTAGEHLQMRLNKTHKY
jgi:isopenicillin N synthase-like dioxygenase